MGKTTRPTIAICYDFDGTLAPGNMQEYSYIPRLKMTADDFWREVGERAREQDGDKILAYMKLMLEKANADPNKNIKLTRESFKASGREVRLFDGVESWFERIDEYGRERGASVEHYIISSGIREMIEGTSVAGAFKRIYASSFMYNQHGVADWPAVVLNYTTKTQFLFRINKGQLDVWDDSQINEYIPKASRPVPFHQMIYIGDGSTDVPCMKLVKDQGGHSIAVYKPRSTQKKQSAERLLREDRVHFVAPADYRSEKLLERQVRSILLKVLADLDLQQLAGDGRDRAGLNS